jgi:hypothetical protein
MRRILSLSTAVASALLLFAPLRGEAAGNVLLAGKVTGPFFFTITYTPDGRAGPNKARDSDYTAGFTNSLLVVLDNNQAAIGTVDGNNNVNLVAPNLIAVPTDNQNNSFILDGFTKNGQKFVSFHAYLFRLSSDPKKAVALGHVVELTADGIVNSTDITLNVQSP